MHTSLPRAVCALLSLTAAGAAQQGPGSEWQVWTLTRTERVLREDGPAGGVAVRIAAARNEWVSFQILMRSGTAVAGVDVRPGTLVGPGGSVLAADDARLFRQHQLDVRAGTYRNAAFRPGWYPDALIPFRHPVTRAPLTGGRLRAVPFDLPANQTHGFWVDLLVPPSASAGDHRGSFRVTAAGGATVAVPVVLTVWDFTLPRVSTMRTALGSPAARLPGYYGSRGYDPPADWAEVEAQCAAMLSRHRINATPPSGTVVPVAQPDGSYRIPAADLLALQQFADRYHVNAFRVPKPTSVVSNPEQERHKLHAWLRSWDAAAAALAPRQVDFYTYLIDEPNDRAAYRFARWWGKAVRRAGSVVKVMVTEQTTPSFPAFGDLYGAVDIWCPLFPLFDPQSAASRQALGETIWTYTALCQREPTPWWHTDFPLLHYRVPAWIAWRYRIRGLLYWGGMVYWNDVGDPWSDPWTLGQHRQPPLVYNGEGTLAYPGRDVGYHGIAPSLRMKALRDGIEDYEYLAILERAGRAADVQQLVVPLARSWFRWGTRPMEYDRVRARLAAMIVAGR